MFTNLPQEIEDKIWHNVHEMCFAPVRKDIKCFIELPQNQKVNEPNENLYYRRYDYYYNNFTEEETLGVSTITYAKMVTTYKWNTNNNNTCYTPMIWRTRTYSFRGNSILSIYKNFHPKFKKELIKYLEENDIEIPSRPTRKQLIKLLFSF